jgi:anti-sigma regulatory factor (Ser/Thr protein kinase)
VLTTYGRQERHLMQLRLAIYEICANITEHGCPSGQRAEIGIHLRFAEGAIQGWIQDCCEYFDTAEVPLVSLPERAAARNRRGYGISVIRQLLDSFEHEFNEMGNRLTFNKRIHL